MEGGGAGRVDGWRPQVWVEVLCVVDGMRRGEQVKGSGAWERTRIGLRQHGEARWREWTRGLKASTGAGAASLHPADRETKCACFLTTVSIPGRQLLRKISSMCCSPLCLRRLRRHCPIHITVLEFRGGGRISPTAYTCLVSSRSMDLKELKAP